MLLSGPEVEPKAVPVLELEASLTSVQEDDSCGPSENATTCEGKEPLSRSGSNASDMLPLDCDSPIEETNQDRNTSNSDMERQLQSVDDEDEVPFVGLGLDGLSSPPTIAPLHASFAEQHLLSVEAPNSDKLEEDLFPLALKELPIHRTRTADDLFENARNFSHCSNPPVIITTCLALIPGWRNILTPEDINVDQIMAGLSNQLFKVNIRDNYPDRSRFLHREVLFRVYGKDVNDLYDSSIELEVFKKLGRRGVAPKMIAEFEGGRIEEWIEGSALLVTDMKKSGVIAGVAAILAGIHEIDLSRAIESSSPCLFTYLNRWRQKAMEIHAKLDENHPSYLAFQRLGLPSLYEESFKLESLLFPKGSPDTPITKLAFCHCDIQENNLMLTKTCMRLIDFEYSGYSFPAYDIASYFWEMTCDYCRDSYPFFHIDPTRYPLINKRRLFMAIYLTKLLRTNIKTSDTEKIDPCLDAVERFQLACHMLWAFWSVIRAPQAATASEFDMLYYAQKRTDAYWSHKANLITNGLISRSLTSTPSEHSVLDTPKLDTPKLDTPKIQRPPSGCNLAR